MTHPYERAARTMDWQQVVLNGGPPCFHLEGKRFCGRAQRWQGHDSVHKFISFADLLADFGAACAREAGDDAFIKGYDQGFSNALEDAAHFAESVRQRRSQSEILRGVFDGEDAEGWTDITPAEKSLLIVVAAGIRALERAATERVLGDPPQGSEKS